MRAVEISVKIKERGEDKWINVSLDAAHNFKATEQA